MDGYELQQELKVLGVALPIIMITGHDDAMARAKCIAAGANTYFNKPLDSSDLLHAIEKAIAHGPRKV
jgi:FixJ family two-component response regulator